jgi:hypothetical protein
MSVKNFKFVSPGVFINEIDNSFIPQSPDAIGPVVIGRSRKGKAMEPVKIESYSDFVNAFGDTVPGFGGGDIYRAGNLQSPMYGTYAAKAFLNSNVAPLTYIRLLGQQTTIGSAAGGDAAAGWKTSGSAPGTTGATNAGAWGLFVGPQPVYAASSASFDFSSVNGATTTGSIFNVTSAAGTGKSYIAISGAIPGSTGELGKAAFNYVDHGGNDPATAAQGFINAVEGAAGHNNGTSGSVFDVTLAGYVVTLTNVISGAGSGAPNANSDVYAYTASATTGISVKGFDGASGSAGNVGTGSLAAVWYLQNGQVQLSGTLWGDASTTVTASNAAYIKSDSSGNYKMLISGSAQGSQTFTFNFNDNSENFIRNQFNTNPQLKSGNEKTFYPTATQVDYWLGETYEQHVRNAGLATSASFGVIVALGSGSAGATQNWGNMKKQASREAVAGWFIGQDTGVATSYNPNNQQKLFRLVGSGHGEWLHKNLKVSIERVRQSNTNTNPYGSFSVVLRNILDTDSAVEQVERFDNLNLDPTSPDFIARKIGDRYSQWDTTNRRLRYYGEYDNKSRFIRVEMNPDVEAGATDPSLLPFGYYGPPAPRALYDVKGNTGPTAAKVASRFITYSGSYAGGFGHGATTESGIELLSGLTIKSDLSASFEFPTDLLRSSSTDGGLTQPTNAYFGWRTTRTATSNTPDASVADPHRLLFPDFPDDPTTSARSAGDGIAPYTYIFSLDNVKKDGDDIYIYVSGSRTDNISVTAGGTYKTLLDANYNRFTAPFWGGFDGWDITKPDPVANSLMSSTSTEDNDYVYHTIRRTLETVSDVGLLDFNLLSMPGLTTDALTQYMMEVCQDRADAMALLDLSSVYTPPHEEYLAKTARANKNVVTTANALKDRRLDSSYGATFYPWVQTIDANTGQLVWIPPSVAMMGVLGSSESKSAIWFAPAGFNRGGLTEGAAGIPITNVSERLSSRERDTLYDARINPIASFPSSGIVVFGQKTLQERPSALDRINVRRLVIYLKKQISVLSTQILFEQNVQATWDRFKGLIEPFLANVKVRFGITDYRLILDESTTTPDLIDQNILYAKIMVKPARAIEFIAIDFVIASTGASFDD